MHQLRLPVKEMLQRCNAGAKWLRHNIVGRGHSAPLLGLAPCGLLHRHRSTSKMGFASPILATDFPNTDSRAQVSPAWLMDDCLGCEMRANCSEPVWLLHWQFADGKLGAECSLTSCLQLANFQTQGALIRRVGPKRIPRSACAHCSIASSPPLLAQRASGSNKIAAIAKAKLEPVVGARLTQQTTTATMQCDHIFTTMHKLTISQLQA